MTDATSPPPLDAQPPAPLTPPGCTMRGNDWFPLKFQRLRRSKWWRRASDVARARNVMMWGEAYQATPAGSLPDDDDDLAEAAGFGMDVEAFLAVKAEIMAPWVKCSDGRWYHPTVCEVVLEAWEMAAERRRIAAEKKAGQRARAKTVPGESDHVPGDNVDCDGDTPPKGGSSQSVPGDRAKKGGDIALQTDRQTDRQIEPPTPLGGDIASLFARIWAAYPETGRASADQDRALKALAPIVEEIGAEALVVCVEKFSGSAYARQDAGRKVPALHRWLTTGKWRNWLETAGAPASTWSGPADLREAIIAHVADAKRSRADAESWVASYLDGSTTWSEVPRAIVCRSGVVQKALRAALCSLLTEHRVGLVLAPAGEVAA